ncbi:MAG: PspC domain-containing protein [Anaerolineales bacterium]
MNPNHKQLTRSASNRMIAGVCAGLGEYPRH